MNTPKLIEGGIAIDDRGKVKFVNGFDFSGVKRFYVVENHRAGFVRAWHAHKKEAKYVTVVKGAAIVGAIPIVDFSYPPSLGSFAQDCQLKWVLSEEKPSVLYIPPSYANGFKTLTDDAVLMFFSTSTVEESKGDDFRFDARLWDIWQEVER